MGNVLLSGWQSLAWRVTATRTSRWRFLRRTRIRRVARRDGFIGKTLPMPRRFDGDFRFSELFKSTSDGCKQATEWQEHYAPGEIELPVGFRVSGTRPPSDFQECYVSHGAGNEPLERSKLKLLAVRSEAGLTLELHYDSARSSRLPRTHCRILPDSAGCGRCCAGDCRQPPASATRVRTAPTARRLESDGGCLSS